MTPVAIGDIQRTQGTLKTVYNAKNRLRHLYCVYIYYRIQTKLRKFNIFTPVFQSFCSQMGVVGGCLPQCMLEYTTLLWVDTPWGRCPPWADNSPGQTPHGQTSPHWADTPLPGRHSPGQTPPLADTPPADGYCCGRYASYWNAFLF